MLVPTTVRQPRIDEVEANPFDANAALGLYSPCANLLDLCTDAGSWVLPLARLVELLASTTGDVELRREAAGDELVLSATAPRRPASDPARAAPPG